MIEPGVYTATLVNHAIGETKKGDPQAVIAFSVSTNKGPQKITYYGSFSEKAREYTIRNLITLGLKGNNPAGELEIGKEVELVIDTEVDQENKERSKVKFINKLGEVRKEIPKDLAKSKLSALEGAVMAARQKLGAQDDSDSIPF